MKPLNDLSESSLHSPKETTSDKTPVVVFMMLAAVAGVLGFDYISGGGIKIGKYHDKNSLCDVNILSVSAGDDNERRTCEVQIIRPNQEISPVQVFYFSVEIFDNTSDITLTRGEEKYTLLWSPALNDPMWGKSKTYTK